MKPFEYFILFNFLALALFSCQRKVNNLEQPNIVWITSEDNSKHYLKHFDPNGIATPNIESLAEQGLTFTHAFSNAPVCSVARSALISGCYGPRIGTQFHRKMQIVPMPDALKMFPEYLREAGYYTTNNAKEDYNIIKSDAVWDDSSKKASWKNRKEGQAFFHVVNIGTTHEGQLHFNAQQMDSIKTSTDPASVFVAPVHPNTPLFRYTNAFYRDKITQMDRQVGEIITELKKEGLLENTFIFYFGDHGGVLPGSKGYLYETGLHVPLVVRVPGQYRHLYSDKIGSTIPEFVSFIDFGPTVLQLAGLSLPEGMDGRPFLVKNQDSISKEEAYGYADRFDEKYDLVRSLRKGKFKYIRNYQPFNFDGLYNFYRYRQLAYQEWLDLYKKDSLDEAQAAFFKPRNPELLFDVEADPYETKNLALDPAFSETLQTMRGKLDDWVKGMPDLSFYPESFLIKNAFDDPAQFGRMHQSEIEGYINIANLSLLDFAQAKQRLVNQLNAEDPWARYWALIVCSSFGEKAIELVTKAEELAQNDPERLVRVRAAEFLGLIGKGSPVDVMTKALYSTEDLAEAVLILNSIVLMVDSQPGYSFALKAENIAQIVKEDEKAKERLKYLKAL